MSLLGKEGIPNLAKLCFSKAQYAADEISKLENFNLFSGRRDFIKEFTVETKFDTKALSLIHI